MDLGSQEAKTFAQDAKKSLLFWSIFTFFMPMARDNMHVLADDLRMSTQKKVYEKIMEQPKMVPLRKKNRYKKWTT